MPSSLNFDKADVVGVGDVMGLDIRNLRLLAGLTQIEEARLSGIERSRLSLAECGHVLLSRDQLEAVASVLRSAIGERLKKYQELLQEDATDFGEAR